MSNPLHLIKPIAIRTPEVLKRIEIEKVQSDFVPIILTNEELAIDIQSNRDRYQSVDLYKTAFLYLYSVAHVKDDAYKYLAILFQYKTYLVKTLLETGIYLAGDTEMRIINRIFESVSEDMTAETAVLCTKLLLDAPKWSSFTLNRLRPGKQTINPNWNLRQIVDSTRVREVYMKLEYCDKKYWSFPLYIQELIDQKFKKVKKDLLHVTALPSLEPVDIKRAREVSEYNQDRD